MHTPAGTDPRAAQTMDALHTESSPAHSDGQDALVVREPLFMALPPLTPRWLTTGMVWGAAVGIAAVGATAYFYRMPTNTVVFPAIVFSLFFGIVALVISRIERDKVSEYRNKNLQPDEIERVVAGSMWTSRRVRSAEVPPTADLNEGFRRLIVELAENRTTLAGKTHGFWPWDEITAKRIARQLPAVSTVASIEIEAELRGIRRDESLLEPEFILTSRPQKIGASLFAAGFFLFNSMVALGGRHWYAAAHMGVFALFMLATTPAIRNRFPLLRVEDFAPVAGLGVIRDHKGRRWTVNDAMMLVWANGARQFLLVYLAGPAGWLMLTFANSADPDFVNLWQRWTHPDPRPELL